MRSGSHTRIVDVTQVHGYEKYLNRCLVGPPSKSYRKRIEYLEKSIPKGFHKKLLIQGKEVVGQIEYSPSSVSYYPITGENLIVMNCIWVLRKAKGKGFGRKLLESMIESERGAYAFVTIALENHWSPWFRKDQMEKLGFTTLDSTRVTHKVKHSTEMFNVYLMWMPNTKNARTPTWNKQKLLEGITCCTAHPLYHPQTYEPKRILEEH
jgi:L-amino acid N-acyltransferase YncA